MKQILITGGPVHAYLDDVKIITNRFKGGLMADLVGKFVKHSEMELEEDKRIRVIYLCSKTSQQPWWEEMLGGEKTPYCKVVHHNGINDYMKQVLEISKLVDAVVLGAAVANLIPKNKINGKFPSHDYKPGDTIPIDFTIAPRVIDEIKRANPKTHLFGFKLLSGVDYYELVRAAYGVLLESKAVTVFANDAKDLMQKYAITKERGVHPITNDEVMQWILDRVQENYYKTSTAKTGKIDEKMKEGQDLLCQILTHHRNSFVKTDEGYIFGSGALWVQDRGLVTTARGKNEIKDFAFVNDVSHGLREVRCSTTKKASLNAPLFYYIFTNYSSVKYILHFHHQREDLVTLPYATPGTDKDSVRTEAQTNPSFNIKGHGCILSYNKDGELIK